jgi:hypothetical protein
VKSIPNLFRKNGIDHVLRKRKGKIALYEQKKGDLSYGYEVHIIRIAKYPTLRIGKRVKKFPLREILASNEDFGQEGFAFQTKESAMNKFQELIKNQALLNY